MDSYDLKSLFDELLRGIREKRAAGKHRGIYWIPQSQLDEERRHENAMALEASRSQGADPYGRSTPEVKQSILDYERSLPQLTFVFEVRSI